MSAEHHSSANHEKQKETSLSSRILGYIIIFVSIALLITITVKIVSLYKQDSLIDPETKQPAKYYLKTLEGFKLSNFPGFDPEFGIVQYEPVVRYKPITPQIIKEYYLWQKTGEINVPEIEPGHYFDMVTGEPLVWYVERDNGKIELFSLPGYDPLTGEILKPMTKDIAKKFKDKIIIKKDELAEIKEKREYQDQKQFLDAEIFKLEEGEWIVDKDEIIKVKERKERWDLIQKIANYILVFIAYILFFIFVDAWIISGIDAMIVKGKATGFLAIIFGVIIWTLSFAFCYIKYSLDSTQFLYLAIGSGINFVFLVLGGIISYTEKDQENNKTIVAQNSLNNSLIVKQIKNHKVEFDKDHCFTNYYFGEKPNEYKLESDILMMSTTEKRRCYNLSVEKIISTPPYTILGVCFEGIYKFLMEWIEKGRLLDCDGTKYCPKFILIAGNPIKYPSNATRISTVINVGETKRIFYIFEFIDPEKLCTGAFTGIGEGLVKFTVKTSPE